MIEMRLKLEPTESSWTLGSPPALKVVSDDVASDNAINTGYSFPDVLTVAVIQALEAFCANWRARNERENVFMACVEAKSAAHVADDGKS